MQNYLNLNPFLPDINNEIPGSRNPQYKTNLKALDRLVLVRFKNDITGTFPCCVCAICMVQNEFRCIHACH